MDGELLTAVLKAFDPSAQTGGPSTVVAVRVNPATQAALALANASAATVINLASTDYGLRTNQIKVKIENGSVSGKKLTTQLGNAYYTQDNVARNALKIRYADALDDELRLPHVHQVVLALTHADALERERQYAKAQSVVQTANADLAAMANYELSQVGGIKQITPSSLGDLTTEEITAS